MTRWSMGLLVLVLSWQGYGAVSCPPSDFKALQRLADKVKEPLNVVFFASWCPACKEHLLAADPKNSVAVLVFDEQARGEEALEYLGLDSMTCLFDNGEITKALGVSSLPMEKKFGGKAHE